ncbi:MAG: hypothetical protein J5626_06385, partial [Lachnospiraceae bacterium]|nr:hypothetical protein [Lachnospiraceae bacterium]
MVKLFYRLIYIIPLTLFGTELIYSYVYGEPLNGSQLFAVVLFAAFLPILSRLNTQMKIITAGGTLIVAGAVIFVALRLDKSEGHFAVYRQIIMILIAVALSAVSFLIINVRAVKIVAAVGLTGFLVVSVLLRYYVTAPELGLCLVFILTVLAEEIQFRYRRGETFEREKYVTFLWPFIFALSLFVAIIKAPEHPYDWDLFVRLYERAKEFTIEMREKIFYSHSEDYNGDMIGFSDDARIGGDVGARAEEIMSISTAKRANQTIYLTGKIFADFNGREWIPAKTFSDKDRTIDSLIAVCHAQMYGQSNSSDYVRLENMDITFLPFSSKYVFAPSKYTYISIDSKNYFPEERDGALFFDKTQIINTAYRITYANVNYNPAAIEVMTSGPKKPDETDWQKALLAYASTLDEELSFAKMQDYQAYVKKNFTETVEVSPAIEESLNKITGAGSTDFERLKILEATLQGMTYTNTPGKLPAKVTDAKSFLDYFLTESQEGYCVHYATAFCLMARAMGYPTRYVQGYMVPVTVSSDTRVDSSMAHAWPEVWLDGVGWIAFEPTPGSGGGNGGWMTTDEKNEAFSEYAESNRPYPYETVGEEEYFELEAAAQEPEQAKIEWYIYVIPLVSFVIFAALFLLVESLMARHRLKKADSEEKACILSLRNLKMLAYMGYVRGQGETLHEFMDRISGEELKDSLAFIPSFERVLYSERAIDNASLAEIQICERKLC